jgi:2-amino-4-hydroxy-6-hydroxymethyldihydropteridine diphosphokinase
MVKAAIGLGSNVGDPVRNVKEAFNRLAEIGPVIAQSSLYQTKPWGVLDQPDFINAAAIIEVDCTARELLKKLLSIELAMGRERKDAERWGPRVIDLDILTFGDLEIDEPQLKIPHRHLFERAFVLAPLAEIDPTFLPAFNQLPTQSQAEVIRLRAPEGAFNPC